MKQKRHIGIFVDWFLPGYRAGGPIRSVANLIQHLAEEFNFSVITSDRDLGMDQAYPGVETDRWIQKNNYRVIYLTPANCSYRSIKDLIQNEGFDLIYLNSLFSKSFSLYPFWIAKKSNSPIVLAPRGMMGSGALSIKPLKKRIFLGLFKLAGLHRRVTWQATALTEKQDILNEFGSGCKIVVAPNLSEVVNRSFEAKVKSEGNLKVYFLSRISTKKNLLAAIQALAKTDPDLDFDLSIMGPVEDEEYWDKCQFEIGRLPDHVDVKVVGEIPHWEISDKLKSQHLLLLPTLNENYGHVIVESWQNGCPVLISDQTPWQDLENKLIGKVYPLSQNANFVKALNQFAQMNAEEFNQWSEAAYGFAASLSVDKTAVDRSRKLLNNQIDL